MKEERRRERKWREKELGKHQDYSDYRGYSDYYNEYRMMSTVMHTVSIEMSLTVKIRRRTAKFPEHSLRGGADEDVIQCGREIDGEEARLSFLRTREQSETATRAGQYISVHLITYQYT